MNDLDLCLEVVNHCVTFTVKYLVILYRDRGFKGLPIGNDQRGIKWSHDR